MLFKLAWNNVKSNRRRTVITLALSAFSAMFFIFYLGMLKGSFTKVYKDTSELYSGYIQITGKGYLDDPSNDHLIFNEKEILAKIKTNPDVAYATSRFESFGLYATHENAFGAMFSAVNPSMEKAMTKMPKHVKEGRYLEDNDTTGVVIGTGLAKRLEIGIGGKLSVITTGADYAFAAENLHVVGIINTHIDEMDNNLVFINKAYFDTFMGSKNMATHILVQPKNTKQSLAMVDTLTTLLNDTSIHIEDWHTYMDDMLQLEQMKLTSGGTMIGLFVLLIFFVVLIYTFLAVQSRIKEVGIMRAIGTKPVKILQILLYETLILATISVIIGGFLGGVALTYFEINPIDMSRFAELYQQAGILEAVFPTQFAWSYVWYGMSYIFILNLISIIYPAWTVIRIKPIDAINHI